MTNKEEIITRLKDGTQLKIKIFQAPLGDESKTILSFLSHKQKNWLFDIERRTRGDFTESLNYYFLGYVNEDPASHIWFTTSAEKPALGMLGHVYTRPEYRKKGISAKILDAAHDFFMDRGGRLMLLHTDSEVAYQYYKRHGYETLSGKPGNGHAVVMCWEREKGELTKILNEENDSYWIERRYLNTGDLPQLTLLYGITHQIPEQESIEEQYPIKNRPQGILYGHEIEAVFPDLFKLDPVTGRFLYLNKVEFGANIIRSIVTVRRRYLPIETVLDFDFYFIPGFEKGLFEVAEEVFSELAENPFVVLEYRGNDGEKIKILNDLGFKKTAEERDYFLISGKKTNAITMRKILP